MKFSIDIKTILGAIIITLIFTSCDDFLLDAAEPLETPGGDDFYDTEIKVKNGVVGIYEALYNIYSHEVTNDGIFAVYINRSDNGIRQPGGGTDRNEFSTLANNAPGKFWNDNYEIVSRANLIISSIELGFPDYQEDEDLARFMGEARFMRAFAYFHLIVTFGNVPMITEQPLSLESARDVTRNGVDQILDEVIITDLEYASENCFTRSQIEELNQIGHVPQAAAKVLLAEAYLTRGTMLSRAEQLAEEVISSPDYTLMANFADIYGAGADNNAESLFEIQYDFPLTGRSTEYTRLLPFVHQSVLNLTTSVTVPTQDLIDTMKNSGDTRFSVTLDTGLYSDPVDPNNFVYGQFWNKYMDRENHFNVPNVNLVDDWNIQLFRLADAYHMAAEAEIQQGKVSEAFDHLNVLRDRANMPLYDPTGVSQDEALDMYLHERRMEFAGEFKRWRDLKRTGKAVEVIEEYLDLDIQETQLVFPIPISEIEANPEGLTQNPGY